MRNVLLALRRPVAAVLLGAAAKALLDYQQHGSWPAALVDGALTACLYGSALLGVKGAVTGIRESLAPPA